jgi:predicted N-acetyltransferase YhbS
MSVNIRKETPADLRRIEAVTVSAFLNAPHTSHTEQHIVNALRKAGRLEISLVAGWMAPLSVTSRYRPSSYRTVWQAGSDWVQFP